MYLAVVRLYNSVTIKFLAGLLSKVDRHDTAECMKMSAASIMMPDLLVIISCYGLVMSALHQNVSLLTPHLYPQSTTTLQIAALKYTAAFRKADWS
jgi:hypothetical protein